MIKPFYTSSENSLSASVASQVGSRSKREHSLNNHVFKRTAAAAVSASSPSQKKTNALGLLTKASSTEETAMSGPDLAVSQVPLVSTPVITSATAPLDSVSSVITPISNTDVFSSNRIIGEPVVGARKSNSHSHRSATIAASASGRKRRELFMPASAPANIAAPYITQIRSDVPSKNRKLHSSASAASAASVGRRKRDASASTATSGSQNSDLSPSFAVGGSVMQAPTILTPNSITTNPVMASDSQHAFPRFGDDFFTYIKSAILKKAEGRLFGAGHESAASSVSASAA